MNEAIIEQATMEDLPQMVDLLYELFGQEGDFVPDRMKQERGLRLILEQPSRGRIFVYRWNETIVGMVNPSSRSALRRAASSCCSKM